ncbi:MAG: sigma-70 family RNA polymerase sigma factor [Candidatus Kuenenia sp.]|nr:sigma-70 family RNA polymerase sigma factor [Candidatus Kuenenia hertensis]
MEEKKLMRMFERDLEGFPMLTQDEERILTRQSKMGDVGSRNRLVESNLRFVLKVAYQYWLPGFSIMDMVSEGCQGLIRATKTFDPDKGIRFLTYAGIAITQGVMKAMANQRRDACVSLDEPLYDDEFETTRKDVLVSEDPRSDEAAFYHQIQDSMNRLCERERMIITLRFWQGLTLEEAGMRLNITKETVRKIEARTLRKLRWEIERNNTPLSPLSRGDLGVCNVD